MLTDAWLQGEIRTDLGQMQVACGSPLTAEQRSTWHTWLDRSDSRVVHVALGAQANLACGLGVLSELLDDSKAISVEIAGAPNRPIPRPELGRDIGGRSEVTLPDGSVIVELRHSRTEGIMSCPMSSDISEWQRHAPRSERCERQTHALRLYDCLLYTSPSPRDLSTSRMPSSA